MAVKSGRVRASALSAAPWHVSNLLRFVEARQGDILAALNRPLPPGSATTAHLQAATDALQQAALQLMREWPSYEARLARNRARRRARNLDAAD